MYATKVWQIRLKMLYLIFNKLDLCGAVAKLVSRHNGIVEITGSNPVCSTTWNTGRTWGSRKWHFPSRKSMVRLHCRRQFRSPLTLSQVEGSSAALSTKRKRRSCRWLLRVVYIVYKFPTFRKIPKIFERKSPPDVSYIVGTAHCAVPTTEECVIWQKGNSGSFWNAHGKGKEGLRRYQVW